MKVTKNVLFEPGRQIRSECCEYNNLRIELPDKAKGIASNVRPRDDFLLCISNRVAKEEREDKVEPAVEEKTSVRSKFN